MSDTTFTCRFRNCWRRFRTACDRNEHECHGHYATEAHDGYAGRF